MPDRLYAATLLRRTAGEVLERLQRPVRTLHDVQDATIAFGQTHIERGSNPLSRLVGWLFGFPPAGRRIPTTITVLATRAAEIWHRRFHHHPILTRLHAGAVPGIIVERFRFGVEFDLAVLERAGSLRFQVRGMRVCGIPIPAVFWPLVTAEEPAERGFFAFDIDIALRGCGRLTFVIRAGCGRIEIGRVRTKVHLCKR